MSTDPASTYPLVDFVDLSSLYDLQVSADRFFLRFEVGGGRERFLGQAVRWCATSEKIAGVVLSFVNPLLSHQDLFFLKGSVEVLLSNQMAVGLWGVDEDYKRKLLGGYLYMRYRNVAIEEPGAEKPSLPEPRSVAQLESCRKFKAESALVAEKHDDFLAHCAGASSPATVRTVYYVTNIDFHSSHSYKDRFIYQCDYLCPAEYSLEFSFLREQAINKSYVDLLESVAAMDRTAQVAYSLAEKEGCVRESFYMFVVSTYGDRLLRDFGITYDYPETTDLQFIGAGIDVTNEQLAGFKIYFRSPKNFLANYLSVYEVDISPLAANYHYLVLRLDAIQEFQSYKVELQFTRDELPVFEHLIPGEMNLADHLDQNEPCNIAIELENERISKVNIYHGSVLVE